MSSREEVDRFLRAYAPGEYPGIVKAWEGEQAGTIRPGYSRQMVDDVWPKALKARDDVTAWDTARRADPAAMFEKHKEVGYQWDIRRKKLAAVGKADPEGWVPPAIQEDQRRALMAYDSGMISDEDLEAFQKATEAAVTQGEGRLKNEKMEIAQRVAEIHGGPIRAAGWNAGSTAFIENAAAAFYGGHFDRTESPTFQSAMIWEEVFYDHDFGALAGGVGPDWKKDPEILDMVDKIISGNYPGTSRVSAAFAGLAAEIPSLTAAAGIVSKSLKGAKTLRQAMTAGAKLGAVHEGMKVAGSEVFGTERGKELDWIDQMVKVGKSSALFAGMAPVQRFAGILGGHLAGAPPTGAKPLSDAMKHMVIKGSEDAALGVGLGAMELPNIPKEEWIPHLAGSAAAFGLVGLGGGVDRAKAGRKVHLERRKKQQDTRQALQKLAREHEEKKKRVKQGILAAEKEEFELKVAQRTGERGKELARRPVWSAQRHAEQEGLAPTATEWRKRGFSRKVSEVMVDLRKEQPEAAEVIYDALRTGAIDKGTAQTMAVVQKSLGKKFGGKGLDITFQVVDEVRNLLTAGRAGEAPKTKRVLGSAERRGLPALEGAAVDVAVHLFRGHSPATVVHEVMHGFYFGLTEKARSNWDLFYDKNRGESWWKEAFGDAGKAEAFAEAGLDHFMGMKRYKAVGTLDALFGKQDAQLKGMVKRLARWSKYEKDVPANIKGYFEGNFMPSGAMKPKVVKQARELRAIDFKRAAATQRKAAKKTAVTRLRAAYEVYRAAKKLGKTQVEHGWLKKQPAVANSTISFEYAKIRLGELGVTVQRGPKDMAPGQKKPRVTRKEHGRRDRAAKQKVTPKVTPKTLTPKAPKAKKTAPPATPKEKRAVEAAETKAPAETVKGTKVTKAGKVHRVTAADGKTYDYVEGEISPADVKIAAKVFQIRGRVDEAGVDPNKRLEDEYDASSASARDFLFWVNKKGETFVVDGHHRLDLAKRSKKTGSVQGLFLFESEGVTAKEARFLGGIRNIRGESLHVIDAAKFIKDAKTIGVTAEAMLDLLGGKTKLRSEAWGARLLDAVYLSRLGPEVFTSVMNNQIRDKHAALIGRYIEDPVLQLAAMRGLESSKPKEAAIGAFIREFAQAAKVAKQENKDLFGDNEKFVVDLATKAKIEVGVLRALARDQTLANMMILAKGGAVKAKGDVKGTIDVDKATADKATADKATADKRKSQEAQAIFSVNVSRGKLKKLMDKLATEIIQKKSNLEEAIERVKDHLKTVKFEFGESDAAGSSGGPTEPPPGAGLFERYYSTEDINDAKAAAKALGEKSPGSKSSVDAIRNNDKIAEKLLKIVEKKKLLEKELKDLGNDAQLLRAAVMATSARLGGSPERVLRRIERQAKGEKVTSEALLEDSLDTIANSHEGRDLLEVGKDVLKDFYYSKAEGDFVELAKLDRDLDKFLFNSRWITNIENIPGGAIARNAISARLKSDYILQETTKKLLHVLKPIKRWRKGLLTEKLHPMMRDLAIALDGLTQLNAAESGTPVGQDGRPSNIEAFIKERAAKWGKDWKKAHDVFREVFDDHARQKAKILKVDPERFGPTKYFPHMHRYEVDSSGSPTGRPARGSQKAGYLEDAWGIFDSSLMKRMKGNPGFVMDLHTVVSEHIPSVIRWLNTQHMQPYFNRQLNGKRVSLRHLKDVSEAYDKLNAVLAASANEFTDGMPENKKIWYGGFSAGEVYVRFTGQVFPSGATMKEVVYEKQGALVKGRETFKATKRDVVPGKEMIERASQSISGTNPFIFLEKINMPGTIWRVPVTKQSFRDFGVQGDGIVHRLDARGNSMGRRTLASEKFFRDYFGTQRRKGEREVRGFEKAFMGFLGDIVEFSHHATLGVFSTKSPITNVGGSILAITREAGFKYTGSAINDYRKKVVKRGGGKNDYDQMIAEVAESGIATTSQWWNVEKQVLRNNESFISGAFNALPISRGRVGRGIRKSVSGAKWLSMLGMHGGEHAVRQIAGYAAWKRAVAPLEKGGKAYQWFTNGKYARGNVERAIACAKRYHLLGDQARLQGYKKRLAEGKLSAQARAETQTLQRDLSEAVFKIGRNREMISVVNRALNIYGVASPEIYRMPGLRVFTMLSQWMMRNMSRTMAEDLPKMFRRKTISSINPKTGEKTFSTKWEVGTDPTKFMRGWIVASLAWQVGNMFGLNDQVAVNASNMTGDLFRDMNIYGYGLSQVPALQQGGPLEHLGMVTNPLLQMPYGSPPSIKLLLGGANYMQGLAGGRDPGYFDSERRKGGEGFFSIALTRTGKNIMDYVRRGDSQNPELPIRTYYTDFPWNMTEKDKKLDQREFDMFWSHFMPGTTKRDSVEFWARRMDQLRSEYATSEVKIKEEAMLLIDKGWGKKADALLLKHDLSLSQADWTRRERAKQEPEILRGWAGLSLHQRVMSLENRVENTNVTKREMRFMCNKLMSSNTITWKDRDRVWAAWEEWERRKK